MADWDRISSTGDVEDRRGMAPMAVGGGLGITGIVIVLLFNLLSGGNSSSTMNDILNQFQQAQSTQQQTQPGEFEGADQYEKFASAVVGSNDELWQGIFNQTNKPYTPAKLVLFRTATQSGCGLSTSQVGPHYCPLDKTIYLDETFFDELQRSFGAKGGDVAEAYVLAHEHGHHIQNQLGIMEQVQSVQQSNPDEANTLSILLELQADCFAGIWAHSISNLGIFQPGEINEAIDAVEAVGDDRIQSKVQGQINPETWTHGSSAQRVEWFNVGLNSGKPSNCNTFAG